MHEQVTEVDTAQEHILRVLEHDLDLARTDPDREFQRRFDRHFPALYRLFHSFYSSRADWLEQLTALVLQCARSWQDRPPELKSLDAEREGDANHPGDIT